MTLLPYRPSNGTEGEGFTEKWCDRCEADAKYRETQEGPDGCQILARTMIFDFKDPEYPKEWVYTEGDFSSARCTAFEAELTGPSGEATRLFREAEKAGQKRLWE